MSASRKPDARTRERQQTASDPRVSAWVSAHAGSGKTHVLASRVIRLLLDGVPPSRILCLTFTKAAAANMSARIFGTLGEWAVADDAALRIKAADLGADLEPGRAALQRARRLFATAVETPGGLKIQTIHAFCERLLHLFPFEANVPAEFRLLDEIEALQMMERARHVALSRMLQPGDQNYPDLQRVSEEASSREFAALVATIAALRTRLDERPAAQREAMLRHAFGVTLGETEEAVGNEIASGLTPDQRETVIEVCQSGTTREKEFAARLRKAIPLGTLDPGAYLDAFISDGAIRPHLLTKKLRVARPDLAVLIDAEAKRLLLLREKFLAARVVDRTIALDRVSDAVIETFSRTKSAMGMLDFEELIAASDTLLQHAAAADWVLYKLDGGIDHILVDEAQDTSAPQWRILEALAREFTAGAGRPGRARTFFAVGDEKQSIFSFQGAAPEKFEEMRRHFSTRIANARLRFEHVQLHLSFRSSPDILAAVDTVFADPHNREGLSADDAPLAHQALKADVPGLVELWPTIGAEEESDRAEWVLPLDLPRRTDPAVQLADRIAQRIRRMIAKASHETVAGEKPGERRAVRAGDVMILVRKRGPLFHAIVRALKEANVPVAGADRIGVTDHIAVMDCMAAGRVALLPQDDLTLATILKSPLIGLDDDDLIALAPGRKGSLWGALRASDDARHRAAAGRIGMWRERAAQLTPFDFFTQILGADGGRRALVARLGEEAHDALDEFLAMALAHERDGAPSLTAFLAELAHLTHEVRRDLEAAGDAARIMTVHGAKGLESKIVFLPDTCNPSQAHRDDLRLLPIGNEPDAVIAWAGRQGDDPPALGVARQKAKREFAAESRRLLYVAMTRAEERLYIAGHYNKRKPDADCWYAMVERTLGPVAREIADPLDARHTIRRIGTPLDQAAPARPSAEAAPQPLPDWITRPAAREVDPGPPLRPSSVLAGADRGDASDAAASRARLRGLAMHDLLRRLPDVPPAHRRDAAHARLAAAWPQAEARDDLVAAVLRVLSEPSLQPLFGEASLAEAPVAARLARKGRVPIDIAGQIDRLAESGQRILFADYKTGRTPAKPPAPHVAQVALYAAALRAIYPLHGIDAYLVYTDGPQVVPVSETQIDAALAKILAGP